MKNDQALRTLKAGYLNLPRAKWGTAESLIGKAERGQATERVWHFIDSLARQIAGKTPQAVVAEQVGDTSRLRKFIRENGPVVALLPDGTQVRFSVQGKRSSTPGAIAVREAVKSDVALFFGRIIDGNWHPNQQVQEPPGLRDLLKQILAGQCDHLRESK